MDQPPGIAVTDSSFDGRADVLLFAAGRQHRDGAAALRTTEDVPWRSAGPAGPGTAILAQSAAIWRLDPIERALSLWAGRKQPLAVSVPSMSSLGS